MARREPTSTTNGSDWHNRPPRGADRSAGPVERAFLIMQTVAAADQPIGVLEIGRRSGIPRSTASRLVAQLEDMSMLERLSDGAVAIGSGIESIRPAGAPHELSLADRARPLLAMMVDRFGESAALTVDTPGGAHYLAGMPGPGAVQVPDSTGHSYPFHLVAPGIVLMSEWPASRLDQYLAGDLDAANHMSVTDPAAIRQRLDEAREQGGAWTNQELDLEVNGVAVPLRTSTGEMIAAVSLHGPAYRLSPTRLPTLIQALTSLPHPVL